MDEPNSKRFRISQEDLPVVDEQLIGVSDLNTHYYTNTNDDNVSVFYNLTSDDGSEDYDYTIYYNPFRIR